MESKDIRSEKQTEILNEIGTRVIKNVKRDEIRLSIFFGGIIAIGAIIMTLFILIDMRNWSNVMYLGLIILALLSFTFVRELKKIMDRRLEDKETLGRKYLNRSNLIKGNSKIFKKNYMYQAIFAAVALFIFGGFILFSGMNAKYVEPKLTEKTVTVARLNNSTSIAFSDEEEGVDVYFINSRYILKYREDKFDSLQNGDKVKMLLDEHNNIYYLENEDGVIFTQADIKEALERQSVLYYSFGSVFVSFGLMALLSIVVYNQTVYKKNLNEEKYDFN